jgi:hypothetical protein
LPVVNWLVLVGFWAIFRTTMMLSLNHNITAYGAIGDGKTLNTAAIQKALDAVGDGGVVIVPPGTFLTGTIFLRSNTVLELLPGATLLGSPRLEDYTRLTTGIAGDRTGYHLVVADGVRNVTIRGQGTIDGNGPSFWEPTAGNRLEEYPQRAPDPVTGRLMWIFATRANDGRPSPMVELRHSQDVRIEQVHLTNSGGWTLHPFDCDRVWIRGIKITSNLMGPNNDGIDITECRDVMISDCDISCCDDAICLKTYPDGRACERVTVTNCVIRTLCAAFKTGEAYGHFRQITFSNSVVYECSRAVALYADDNGFVEDVTISNIVCDTRSPLMMNRPIHIEASSKGFYQPNSDGIPQGKRPARGIRNVSISNFIARTDGRVLLTAGPGAIMENITLRDLHLIYPTVDDPDPIGASVGGSQFSKSNPAARVARGAVVAENVRGLVVDGLRVDWPAVDAQGRVQTPAEWRFERKAANGSRELYERAQFNHDTIPDFAVVWGRNLQDGYIRAPLARPPRTGLSRFHLADSTIVTDPR